MLQLVDPGGSINTVWHIASRATPGTEIAAPAASSALGKLEIKWRGMLGDPGRLQTQQIQAPTPLPKVPIEHVQTAPGAQMAHCASAQRWW